MKRSLSLLALVALVAPLGSAQSLGEAAARERERRKNTPPAKAYTDADVRTVTPSTAADGGDTAASDKPEAEGKAPAESGAATVEKSPDELRAEAEKGWLGQIDKLNAEIAKLDADIAHYEAQANDTRGYVYSNRRTVAIENLEKARAARAAARQSLDDLLESGRRQGFRAP